MSCVLVVKSVGESYFKKVTVTVRRLHQSVLSSALHFPGSSCLYSWTHSLSSHLFLVLFISITCLHIIMFDSSVYLVPSVLFSPCRSLSLLPRVMCVFLSVSVLLFKVKLSNGIWVLTLQSPSSAFTPTLPWWQ